jgi:hypothetical protein
MSLPEYLERFLGSLRWAPRIEQTHVWSVAYCRTRGATGHPFLVVHLEHPELYLFPVRLKLRGFDGPINAQVDGTGRRRRYATLSVASVDQTMAELVGTRRYDVLHTMKFQPRLTDAGRRIEPDIGDLLTLAELAIKWDHSREGYPATLFSAMKTLFDNCVTSGKKGVPSASGLTVTPEMKSSVIDAFPTWRKRMQGEMDFRLRRGSHVGLKFPSRQGTHRVQCVSTL